jgi:cytochrome P450
MAFADEITVEALEADPYPIFARLRREAPVAWVPAANVWFVTRWQDVEFVSKNTALFTAEVATSPVERSREAGDLRRRQCRGRGGDPPDLRAAGAQSGRFGDVAHAA